MNRSSFFCLFAMFFLVNSARAALLLSDDFSSVGGGTGWQAASSWDGAASISGGKISHSGQSFRTFASPISIGSADFWFATRIALSGDSSRWGAISFYDGTDEDVYFGTDSASTVWEFGNGSEFPDQSTSVSSFNQPSAVRLLAHVTTSKIDMWVDPSDTSSVAALGLANASVTNNPIDPSSTWNRLGIRSHSSVTITVDDLAVATTLSEAVSGVPEPSSFAFMGVVGLLAVFIRRKIFPQAESGFRRLD